MKIVAMIPTRLGSKRIKHKNLRLLDGKPLVSHVLKKCKDADIFSEIYINSESGIFKSVADEYGNKRFAIFLLNFPSNISLCKAYKIIIY